MPNYTVTDVIGSIEPMMRDFELSPCYGDNIVATHRQNGKSYTFRFDGDSLTLEGLDKKSDDLINRRLAS